MRHRLQKAIEAGAEFIPATVFPEVTGRDAAWARMHDFEQNVLDNQASVADTALYVRGMNPKGRQLTEEETKQFTRQGSNSEAGSYIGLHGSTELINYLAAGLISPDYAHQIAQLAPGNADVQQVAIDALMQDKGITEAKQAAEIYRDNQALKESDIFQSLGNSPRQEAFMRFLSQYATNKIRTLGNAKRVHKGAKTDKSIREHEAAGVKFEDAAKNRAKLQELSAEQEAWKNVGTHPELIEEAKAEFDKTAEGAQQYLDFGNFSIQEAERVRDNFNNVHKAKPISIDTPSAYQADIKAAIKSVRENYRILQNNPVTMKDGKVVRFGKGGFNEIKNHAADRRVIAVIPYLKELCESAEYMYSARNSEPHKPKKADISQYHYYLNKASFSGLANDSYILIAVAERNTGEFFYDLDATDIETIDNIKGATDILAATRVPNSEQQGGAPESRIQNLKKFVNHLEQVFSIKDSNFSIASLSPGDRFAGNPLAERMSNYLRREAKRFARVLGDKTPHDTAVNAINSARSVIGMLDKYVHTNAIPISRDARNRLNLLQRIIEKYAQIIEKGSKRSFNQIAKEEQGVLDAIVEEMGAALETGQTKETAKARYKELIRMAAKGRVWQLLSEMMTEAGNLVDSYLKDELLKKLKRVTNTVKLKRSKSGKLKGKMGAADYRRMDTVVQLMGMSTRAKDDALGQIEEARLLLNAHKNEIPELSTNELIEEIRGELTAQGKEVTAENVYMALNNREADLLTFADLDSMDYTKARKAANALATLISVGRAKWELIQQEKKIKAFLDHFYKHTSALHGTAQEAAQFFCCKISVIGAKHACELG